MTQELIHGIEALTAFALDAIRSSGQTALDYFGKGRGATKFDQGLVTRAELQISTCFQQALDNQYPDHRMFTSKTLDTTYTHDNRRYLWIFDPIDGVDNYQAGIPIWGMSLALLENFWPVFGAFYMPATGDLFHARAGGKAFWGEKRIRIPDEPFDPPTPGAPRRCVLRSDHRAGERTGVGPDRRPGRADDGRAHGRPRQRRNTRRADTRR